MDKTLRLLGLAAVLGAAGIVIAQQSVARIKTQNAPPSEVVVASKGRSMLSSNGVTESLVGYFCVKQQFLIDRVKREGHEDRVDAVIRANCSALLTLMTPVQQKVELAEMQIDKYQPGNAAWSAVARTPSLVNELLHVDGKTSEEAQKALDLARDQIFGPFRAISEKIVDTPEYKAAPTKLEKNRVYQKLYDQMRPRFDPVKRSFEIVGYHEKSVEKVRTLLSPSQRAEYDSIRFRFEQSIAAAANGESPL